MNSSDSVSVRNSTVDLRHKTTAPKSDVSSKNAQISTYNNYSDDDFTSVSQTVLICKR